MSTKKQEEIKIDYVGLRRRTLEALSVVRAEDLRAYADAKAVLLPSESLEDWPETKLPRSRKELTLLVEEVKSWVNASTVAAQPTRPAAVSVPEDAQPVADLKRTKRVKSQPQDLALGGLKDIRQMPSSPESEMCVIGCCFVAPKECIPQVQVRFGGVQPSEVFYDQRHATIFQAQLRDFDENGGAVDIVTVMERLKKEKLLEQCGGIAYLAACGEPVTSAWNLKYWLDIVWEKYLLRRAVLVCCACVASVYEFTGPVDELLDKVETDVLAIRTVRASDALRDAKTVAQQAAELIEHALSSRGALTGLSTGFADVDTVTDGLHPQELIVVGGFTSDGKTALAMNIAEHAAVDLKVPTAVFTMEMSNVELMTRCVASRARVNLRDVANLDAALHFPRITAAAGKLGSSPLWLDDASDLTAQELRAKARRMSQQHGIKLFVVDYAQLLTCPGEKNQTREQEVSNIGRHMKQMAKELDATVLLLSQLNDDGKLRESRALGQHANSVWKLKARRKRAASTGDASDAQPEDYEAQDVYPVDILFSKLRSGRRFEKVTLVFRACYTRFENASKVSDEDGGAS